MTCHKSISVSGVAVCSLLALGIALGPGARTHADTMPSLFNGLVFAHDMENISGNTITGLHGTPNATKTTSFSVSTTAPLPGSTQHLLMPPLDDPTAGTNGQPYGWVNTNTELSAPTSGLSFSAFYNINPNAVQESAWNKRFLTTYSGGGGVGAGELLFDASPSSGASHNIRFFTDGQNKSWTGAVTRDGDWHHIGFVFDSGTVRLYVDGAPFGADQTLTSSTIAIQDRTWRLLEESNHREFFRDSFFDEAALWHRAISDEEMLFVYQYGLAAIPEPTSAALLLAGALAGLIAFGRKRRMAR